MQSTQLQIDELQRETVALQQRLRDVTAGVLAEGQRFRARKASDLRQVLTRYASSQIDLHRLYIASWQAFL
jgi:hypothetical protein